jgi:hypothetical protein
MLTSTDGRQASSFFISCFVVGLALVLSSSICLAQTATSQHNTQNKNEWKMLDGEYRLEGVVYSTYAPYKSFLIKVASLVLSNGSRIPRHAYTIDNVSLSPDTNIHVRGNEQPLDSSDMKIGDSVVVLASRDTRRDCWTPREIAVWNQADDSGYQLVHPKSELPRIAGVAAVATYGQNQGTTPVVQPVAPISMSDVKYAAPTKFGSPPVAHSTVAYSAPAVPSKVAEPVAACIGALPPAPAPVRASVFKTAFSNAPSQDQGDVQFSDVAQGEKNAQELQVGAGEILLQGVVRSSEAANGRLILSTAYFALPSGHVKRLRRTTDKTISLNSQTILLSDDTKIPCLDASQIRVGAIVTVIGQDLGTGQNLPARIMTVANPVEKPETRNALWQKPRQNVAPAPMKVATRVAPKFPVDLNVHGAAKRIAQIAYLRHQQGAAGAYRHRCQALVRTTVQQVTRQYDGFFKSSARSTMNAFRSAGVGRPYTRGTVLKPGDLLYTGQWGGQAGHAMIVGPKGRILDNVGEGIADPDRRPIDWIIRLEETRLMNR